MSEIRENVESAAILCLEVCACDVMNKASMCDRSVYYVMSHPVLCPSLVKNEPT